VVTRPSSCGAGEMTHSSARVHGCTTAPEAGREALKALWKSLAPFWRDSVESFIPTWYTSTWLWDAYSQSL